jgi:hypothetical protein
MLRLIAGGVTLSTIHLRYSISKYFPCSLNSLKPSCVVQWSKQRCLPVARVRASGVRGSGKQLD